MNFYIRLLQDFCMATLPVCISAGALMGGAGLLLSGLKSGAKKK
jgi:hypothetical protein